MTYEEVREEVERRTRELLPVVLLREGVVHHARRKGVYRICDCDYCRLRRQITIDVENAGRFRAYGQPRERRAMYYVVARRQARRVLDMALDEAVERVGG